MADPPYALPAGIFGWTLKYRKIKAIYVSKHSKQFQLNKIVAAFAVNAALSCVYQLDFTIKSSEFLEQAPPVSLDSRFATNN